MFAKILSNYWWMTLLRGILWLLFGILIFAKPGISLLSLTLFVGLVFFVDGIANVIAAFGGRKEENWWVLLLVGVAGIGLGVLTFMNPTITGLALLFYIAIWAIATGLLEIGAAIRLRREIKGEFWLILAGLLSVAFGVFLVARPAQGALAVLWIIGAFSVVFGVVLITLAIRSRHFLEQLSSSVGGGYRAA